MPLHQVSRDAGAAADLLVGYRRRNLPQIVLSSTMSTSMDIPDVSR